MLAVGWFRCAAVAVVGVGTTHDVGDGLSMFFTVQRDSIHHLTLSIVVDGGLHVRFKNTTHCELLTVLQLLDCIQRPDYVRSLKSCKRSI
jgi:hypothetical protein